MKPDVAAEWSMNPETSIIIIHPFSLRQDGRLIPPPGNVDNFSDWNPSIIHLCSFSAV